MLPPIRTVLGDFTAPLLQNICGDMDGLEDLCGLIEDAIIEEETPISSKEGGIIKPGFSEEVDHFRKAKTDGKAWLAELEEKAANLLYFITKNHSFFDGNKRIAATMFLYFLDRNQALVERGKKRIEDATLVALTIMIAESRPEEKEMMISVIMNCIQ